MTADDEARRYAAARAAGIAAAKRAWPVPLAGPMPLDLAARFLPDHPEWARYAPKRLRRGKAVR